MLNFSINPPDIGQSQKPAASARKINNNEIDSVLELTLEECLDIPNAVPEEGEKELDSHAIKKGITYLKVNFTFVERIVIEPQKKDCKDCYAAKKLETPHEVDSPPPRTV